MINDYKNITIETINHFKSMILIATFIISTMNNLDLIITRRMSEIIKIFKFNHYWSTIKYFFHVKISIKILIKIAFFK